MIKASTKKFVGTKRLVYTALFVSLGIVLPMAFHAVPNAGKIFLPMHIPILLCGIVCGFPFGLICGVLTPVLSFFFTGMPSAAMLPSMIFELAVYGTVTSLLVRLPIKNSYAKIYTALVGAMLCGRFVSGALNAMFFRAGNYSTTIWLAASFITAWPGILIQITVIPALVKAMQKAKLFDFELRSTTNKSNKIS